MPVIDNVFYSLAMCLLIAFITHGINIGMGGYENLRRSRSCVIVISLPPLHAGQSVHD